MKIHGWIPHLGPGLDAFLPDPLKILRGFADPSFESLDADEEIRIRADLPGSFIYGETVLQLHVSYGGISVDVESVLERRGILSLEVSDPVEHDVQSVGLLLSEAFIEIRNRILEGIRHYLGSDGVFDYGGPCQLPGGRSDLPEGAIVREIFDGMLRSIRDNDLALDRITSMPEQDDLRLLFLRGELAHHLYRSASRFISFAINFVGLYLGGGAVYMNSLRAYQSSLDSLYASHCNGDTHRLNAAFLESADLMRAQSQCSTRISMSMNRYTFLMLVFTALNLVIAASQALPLQVL